jgi:hypothetical protein
MADLFTCRHCGHRTEVPQVLKGLTDQRVLEYIWRHPGCTVKDIHAALFVAQCRSNLAGVIVSKIKRVLPAYGFTIVNTKRNTGQMGRRSNHLTIVTIEPKGQSDVPSELTSSLP